MVSKDSSAQGSRRQRPGICGSSFLPMCGSISLQTQAEQLSSLQSVQGIAVYDSLRARAGMYGSSFPPMCGSISLRSISCVECVLGFCTLQRTSRPRPGHEHQNPVTPGKGQLCSAHLRSGSELAAAAAAACCCTRETLGCAGADGARALPSALSSRCCPAAACNNAASLHRGTTDALMRV